MKDCLLIFDLDGTLWDAAEQVADSWNIIRKEFNKDLPAFTADDIRSVMGRTMEEISQILFSEIEMEDREKLFHLCEEFEVRYIAKGHPGEFFPNVEDTLKKLAEEGYKMAVVSNCQKGYIDAFFVSTGLKTLFIDSEEWGNTGLSKAENIRLVMKRNKAEQAVYIGDTIGDENSSKEAGIPFVFAAYGFGTAKDPDAVIQSFEELPKVVCNLS